MSANKRKNILILALVFCCCIVTVGYFSLVNNAIIEGRINFASGKSEKTETWKIKFNNVETVEEVGNAYNIENPYLSDYLISFNVQFEKVGDAITYEVEVANNGTLDAKLENIQLTKGNDYLIDFKYSGIKIGDILMAGEKKKFKITVSYKTTNDSLEGKSEKVQLVLNWKQAD